MEDVEKRLEDKDLRNLKELAASQKPVNEIVRYLLYFWLTISVVLGFFGWRQISDFDEQVTQAVVDQLPSGSANYAQFAKLIADTESLRDKFEELTEQYTDRLNKLARYAEVEKNFDIEGELELLVREGTDDANITNSEWRTRAIMTIRAFASALEEGTAAPGDFVFNVAQLCRKLRQFGLIETMANAAYDRDPSPAVRAMVLSSRVAIGGAGTERDDAFAELVGMVEALDYEANPQIVLAEAWNAAEDTRQYQVFIDALDRLLSERAARGEVPSFAYVIKSKALLRRGNPNAKEQGIAALDEGYAVYKEESPYSQWAGAFAIEYMGLSNVIRSQEDITAALDNTALDTMTSDDGGLILDSVLEALLNSAGRTSEFDPPTAQDVENAIPVGLGKMERHAFRPDGTASWHSVSIQEALTCRIDATSSNGDPVVAIWSGDGQSEQLASNDDGGSGRDARIDIELEPGSYYLSVRNYTRGEGEFSLVVRSMAP